MGGEWQYARRGRLLKNLEYLRFYDFTGGVNDSGNPAEIAQNEAQDALNTILAENGMLQQRKGRGTSVGQIPGTDVPCLGMARCYRSYGTGDNLVTNGRGTLGIRACRAEDGR